MPAIALKGARSPSGFKPPAMSKLSLASPKTSSSSSASWPNTKQARPSSPSWWLRRIWIPKRNKVNDAVFFAAPSILHHRHLPFYLRAGPHQCRPDARGHVSPHQYSRRPRGHLLQRYATGADRSGHHGYLRALLHPGERNRPYGIAFDVRRQPDQNLFSAGHGCQRRCHADLQSRHGRPAALASGHFAACRHESGRVEPSRLSTDRKWTGAR